MTTSAVKITRKGQVTIPKEIRDILKANAIYFEVEDDTVMVRSGTRLVHSGTMQGTSSRAFP